MKDEITKLMQYCALQGTLLGLYDPKYDACALLSELQPKIAKARRENNPKALESLKQDLTRRVQDAKALNPNPSDPKKLKDTEAELSKLELELSS